MAPLPLLLECQTRFRPFPMLPFVLLGKGAPPPPTGLRRHASFPPPWSGVVETARRGQVFILGPALFSWFPDDFLQVLNPGELNTAE